MTVVSAPEYVCCSPKYFGRNGRLTHGDVKRWRVEKYSVDSSCRVENQESRMSDSWDTTMWTGWASEKAIVVVSFLSLSRDSIAFCLRSMYRDTRKIDDFRQAGIHTRRNRQCATCAMVMSLQKSLPCSSQLVLGPRRIGTIRLWGFIILPSLVLSRH